MAKPYAILIAGPTASGKSARAIALAREQGGIIINADSMQVYRDLRILTARPSTEEENSTPHALYGHVNGAEHYSVARWLDDVADAMSAAKKAGQMPVLVGGTGLYFKALLEGLSPIPEIPDDIRDYWRTAAANGGEALHAKLTRRDPGAAGVLRPSDRQRLVRALEVIDATGRSILDWQKVPGTPLLQADHCQRLVIAPPRETLYQRCDQRFKAMMDEGAAEEVEALINRNLSEDCSILGALGVRPIMAMLRGDISRNDAIAQAQTDTRRYAKRQLTWTRNQMSDWNWSETAV